MTRSHEEHLEQASDHIDSNTGHSVSFVHNQPTSYPKIYQETVVGNENGGRVSVFLPHKWLTVLSKVVIGVLGRRWRRLLRFSIAECVSVSCCPCAVVNIFTLTFLKLPWMMGRKCLGNKNKKKKLIKHEDKYGSSRREQGENGAIELGSCKVPANHTAHPKYSARYEVERVWLELYKVGHLGFGRVSFSGIQSLGW
ncbi:uncharacterized protein LOC118488058 [Helianthus annuus]|uniref:uncharacterized protein LOC118488058 n=1 Tax=Helianthus annuus TaxID=4232 RepID=UPI0016532440|nr:uncharacterized protein LOC118488058 [Helianthus annuus]